MVTIRIKGGLGNQLFQYAAGYALAKRMNQKLKLDSSFFPQQTLRGFKLGYLNVTFGDVVEHQHLAEDALALEVLENRAHAALVDALNARRPGDDQADDIAAVVEVIDQILRQEYDYGLLDPELDRVSSQSPDTEAPYGAFDLIETSPDEVGGP